ncbi:MAG: Ig-like domain-containing protein [Planctomycetota bacterium]
MRSWIQGEGHDRFDRVGGRRGNQRPRRLRFEPLEQRRLLTSAADPLAAVEAAEGESSPPLAAFRLEATDSEGMPLTRTPPGSDFYLSAWVSDQRPSGQAAGVYAAYLDVSYDEQLVSVVPATQYELGFDIEFDPAYRNGKSGSAFVPGLIDEVGAFQTDFEPLGGGETLLFRVRFSTAEVRVVDDYFADIPEDSEEVHLDVLANDVARVGKARFTGSPADIRPLHEVVLRDPATAVPDESLEFVPAEVEISGEGEGVIDGVGTPSGGGSVRIAADGSGLVYEPAPNFSGTETFSYWVGRHQAEVTVVVEPVNDTPIGEDDIYSIKGDDVLVVDAAGGVLANDEDPEGDLLAAELVQGPGSGTVTLRRDGSFEYVPATGFRGRDTFTYVADDSELVSEETTVRIDVGMPQVSLRLEVTDADARRVDSLSSDERLFLRVWVQDLRDEHYVNRGVFATYLDVLYDEQLLQPIVDDTLDRGFEIEPGPEYRMSGSGDVDTPGVVNEVGAVAASSQPLGSSELLLFEMPLEVTGPFVDDIQFDVSMNSAANSLQVLENNLQPEWSTELVAESADELPDHEILTFEPATAVANEQVVFSGTRVDVLNASELTIIDTSTTTAAGGTTEISRSGQGVLYSPPPGFIGTDSFLYTVADPHGRTAEATASVHVFATWQNLHEPIDVNSDTHVSPLDALLVIHDLNQNGSRQLEDSGSGPPFIDVNGDGVVSPIDALTVINSLNGGQSSELLEEGDEGGEGEFEGVADSASFSMDASARAPANSLSATSTMVSGESFAGGQARTEPLLKKTLPEALPGFIMVPDVPVSGVEELEESELLRHYWDNISLVSSSERALPELLEWPPVRSREVDL